MARKRGKRQTGNIGCIREVQAGLFLDIRESEGGNYGNDLDYHNYQEGDWWLGGGGSLGFGGDEKWGLGKEVRGIPPNYAHTTNSDLGTSVNGSIFS